MAGIAVCQPGLRGLVAEGLTGGTILHCWSQFNGADRSPAGRLAPAASVEVIAMGAIRALNGAIELRIPWRRKNEHSEVNALGVFHASPLLPRPVLQRLGEV
jgi:hypothetical protein